MTAAGDLNDDGYNDVAISAPFAEDHQGVVYIYHGSAKGISKDVKQVNYYVFTLCYPHSWKRIPFKYQASIDLCIFGSTFFLVEEI